MTSDDSAAPRLVAAADGSALGNPGPAGWAWYVDDDCWHAGGWSHGTNNMGELMAVLDLLESTADPALPLTVLCDSTYVIKAITEWMPNWKRRGWKKGDGKPVLNQDLLRRLDAAVQGRDVRFEWIKGHSGHDLNEAADQRARAVATAYQRGTAPDPGPGLAGRVEALAPAADRASTSAPAAEDELPALFDTEPTDEEQVLAAQRELADPRLSQDRLDQVLHPHGRGVCDGRVLTRSDLLDDAGLLPTGRIEPIELSVVAPGAALLLWRSSAAGEVLLGSALWLLTPSGWRQRSQQTSAEA